MQIQMKQEHDDVQWRVIARGSQASPGEQTVYVPHRQLPLSPPGWIHLASIKVRFILMQMVI